ncbi:MAG: pyruvate synthase, partial [Roseburia hominis]|nr:pyruvate synthase [Roseburia hominis]
MEKQKIMYDSGNELAAYAARQINYHVMGYYPITPSTQIAENLDVMGAEGLHDIALIAAEGEHSAAGICYGASAAGGRVFNATSANGLLYALEQFPVQSGTRMPMVMNVACRTVSGPLCIKGDHSDVMYLLNTGWIILFADEPQKVYDFNLLGLKLAEAVRLPVAVAFDGFFTSHQKRKCLVFENDDTVTRYIGEKLSCDNPKVSAFAGTGSGSAAGELPYASVLDLAHPVSIGSYMNEPDVINNRYQLHLAMEAARNKLPELFTEYAALSGRDLSFCGAYRHEDAEVLLFVLGSSYHTAMEAVDRLRQDGVAAGVITLYVLRPFPAKELRVLCHNASTILAADRQDSYGAGGGNMSLELKAALSSLPHPPRILSRIYGLGGKDFFVEDALALFKEALSPDAPAFDYYGVTAGTEASDAEASSTSGKADQSMAAPAMQPQYFKPVTKEESSPGLTTCTFDPATGKMKVSGGSVKDTTAMPMR